MKLSTRARYALRMMVELARLTNGTGETVSLSRIAEESHISRRYLEQLAIVLKSNTLIRGKTGKGGGYRLAKSAKEITAGDIIEAAIGQINIVDCVLDPEACDMAEQCGCRSVYCDINTRIAEALDDLTLDALSHKHRKSESRI